MKKSLLIFSILSVANTALKAQKTGLQIGPVASFFGKGQNNFGGEVVANISVQKILSVGAGFQLLKVNVEPNIYTPVFATFNLSIPLDKIVFFFHVDPGYGIYSDHIAYTTGGGDFKFDFKTTGGFYLGTGAGIHFKSKVAPYINLQYSVYGFHLRYSMTNLNDINDDISSYEPIPARGVTITAGVWLHNKQ